MYPRNKAPYTLDFHEAHAGIKRIRKLIEEGLIIIHPEGGKAYIEEYDKEIWMGFGQVVQGLYIHIKLTNDEVVCKALNNFMLNICGFEVLLKEKRISLLNFEPLRDSLNNLENTIKNIKNRFTLNKI